MEWSWPNLRNNPGIFLEGLRVTTEIPSQDRWSPVGWLVGSLINDAFSVTRLYSVDDRMIRE
jgi:hypothetical protein